MQAPIQFITLFGVTFPCPAQNSQQGVSSGISHAVALPYANFQIIFSELNSL